MHRAVINNLISKTKELKISIPRNNNEDECLKYCYVGTCNAECHMKKNHTPVKMNSDRYKRLLAFREKALEIYNKSKQPNDQNCA